MLTPNKFAFAPQLAVQNKPPPIVDIVANPARVQGPISCLT
jgi:hypothetical protein